jgi:hypothetical protein
MSDARAQWRSWFAPTGQPAAWAMVGYMVGGLVVGASLAAALPEVRGTLLAALAGVVVGAAGSSGPSGISRRVALIAAGLGLILTTVAFATGNRPWWAAIAMGLVALGTSLAAAAGPLGGPRLPRLARVLPRGQAGRGECGDRPSPVGSAHVVGAPLLRRARA